MNFRMASIFLRHFFLKKSGKDVDNLLNKKLPH